MVTIQDGKITIDPRRDVKELIEGKKSATQWKTLFFIAVLGWTVTIGVSTHLILKQEGRHRDELIRHKFFTQISDVKAFCYQARPLNPDGWVEKCIENELRRRLVEWNRGVWNQERKEIK